MLCFCRYGLLTMQISSSVHLDRSSPVASLRMLPFAQSDTSTCEVGIGLLRFDGSIAELFVASVKRNLHNNI